VRSRSLTLKNLLDVEVGPSNLLFTAVADDLRLHLVDRRDVGPRRQRVLILFLKAPDVLLERAAEDLLRDSGAGDFDKPSARSNDRRHGRSLPTHLYGHTRPTLLRSSTPRPLHRCDSMGSKQLGAVRRESSVKWSSLCLGLADLHRTADACCAWRWRGPSGTAFRIQGDLTNVGIWYRQQYRHRQSALSPALSVVRRAQQLQAGAAKRCELLALQSAHSTGTGSTSGTAIFGVFKLMGSSFGGGGA
jgi:hypothetical protein